MKDNLIVINSPDNVWHAEISACRGANIQRLKYGGEDVFNPLKSQEQWKQNPFVQGSPLLLPANRTVGGKFSYNGSCYSLPVTDKKNNVNLHGFLYCQPFSVVETSSNSAVLRYENGGGIYPFNFCITAEYILKSSGLKQIFTIENRDKTDMPYTFALHTTFFEPDFFSVPIKLAQEKDARHIPTGRYVPLSTAEYGYVSGINPRGISISGYYKSNGNTARIGKYCYTVSEQFDHFVLYNAGENSGYLCVEPQVGAVNGLNVKGGHREIAAGGRDVLCTHIGRYE